MSLSRSRLQILMGNILNYKRDYMFLSGCGGCGLRVASPYRRLRGYERKLR